MFELAAALANTLPGKLSNHFDVFISFYVRVRLSKVSGLKLLRERERK